MDRIKCDHFSAENGLMVIIPHEDDEINLAGALIFDACRKKIPVKCVFLTNGDAEYPAFIRIHEAVKALKTLGVKEENIYFLGYPDGGRHGERSPFLHNASEIRKAGGHAYTYGCRHFKEFAALETGAGHPCNWDNLLEDLQNIILKYKPSVIVGTDFDYHPDHRMCYLALMEAMNRILHRVQDYYPDVLMGYCYTTGFDSVPDFYGKHLLSTVVNKNTQRNTDFETENPTYEWDKRIRLPIPAECRNLLMKNVLFKSLCCHLSQKASRRAVRLINGDEVFWQRRTNNLAINGHITVSSGNAKYLTDFHMMNTKDIVSEKTEFRDYLWVPDKGDSQGWCRCDFETPRHVESVVLYGNIENDSRITKGKLSFSTGYSCQVEALEKQGHETLIHFPPQDNVTWVKFEILDKIGPHAGIAEWEILPCFKSYFSILQILVNEQFAYDWYVYPDEQVRISEYAYGVEGGFTWFLNGKPMSLAEIQEIAQKTKQKIKIRVESKVNPSIWCESYIIPAGCAYRLNHFISQLMDRVGVWWENQKEKRPHHLLRKIKNEDDYRI